MSADESFENGDGESVRAYVRIRSERDDPTAWNFNEKNLIEDTQSGQRNYSFDHCFGPDSTNEEAYDYACSPIIQKVLEGYNGTVFTCEYETIIFKI